MGQEAKSLSADRVGEADCARVLFFGREHCSATVKARDYLKRVGFDVTFVISKGRGQKLPDSVYNWQGEYIFCFRSLFILKKIILDKAAIAAINFHPAPTEYPGSGCINFALYDYAEEYGVTAHLMNEKVDNGKVLICSRFRILKADTVDSLLDRTHSKMLEVFYELISRIEVEGKESIGQMIKESMHEEWNGDARKMSEIDTMQKINIGISQPELDRVIRATYVQQFPLTLILHGYKFVLNIPNGTE